jgi:hypothetical protein
MRAGSRRTLDDRRWLLVMDAYRYEAPPRSLFFSNNAKNEISAKAKYPRISVNLETDQSDRLFS